MAHFPPKICFKYIFTHSRDLWFKLEYILPRSWFSEGGSEGFHEAQICREKKSSHAALSIFSQYLAQNESVHCMKTTMDRQPLNVIEDKEQVSTVFGQVQGFLNLNEVFSLAVWAHTPLMWCSPTSLAPTWHCGIYVRNEALEMGFIGGIYCGEQNLPPSRVGLLSCSASLFIAGKHLNMVRL